ncbi:MAG: hypothetical protein R3E50_17635, partial [Halioglobus sp.]
MNEFRRRAYLQAMGVDSYVSRAQLPGAAPTPRRAVARAQPRTVPPHSAGAAGEQSKGAPRKRQAQPGLRAPERAATAGTPQLASPPLPG